MNAIPTKADWEADPAAALAVSIDLAKACSAHGDASTQSIAMGIAAKVVAAAAPLVGAAVGGPAGALAGAVVAQLAVTLEAQQANALGSLTPDQRALVDTAIATGVAAATKKP